jgi:hypothetical protein
MPMSCLGEGEEEEGEEGEEAWSEADQRELGHMS